MNKNKCADTSIPKKNWKQHNTVERRVGSGRPKITGIEEDAMLVHVQKLKISNYTLTINQENSPKSSLTPDATEDESPRAGFFHPAMPNQISFLRMFIGVYLLQKNTLLYC